MHGGFKTCGSQSLVVVVVGSMGVANGINLVSGATHSALMDHCFEFRIVFVRPPPFRIFALSFGVAGGKGAA